MPQLKTYADDQTNLTCDAMLCTLRVVALWNPRLLKEYTVILLTTWSGVAWKVALFKIILNNDYSEFREKEATIYLT